MDKPKLDGHPARRDLTDRECTKVLCGLVGALVQMAEPETLERAVAWIANTPEFWAQLRAQKHVLRALDASPSAIYEALVPKGEKN